MSEEMGLSTEIYVRLLDEGTDVFRPTRALAIGEGIFKILPTESYNPDDEVWEFPPGSVVRVKLRELSGEKVMLANALVNEAEGGSQRRR